MKRVFHGGLVYYNGLIRKLDIVVEGGVIIAVAAVDNNICYDELNDFEVIDCEGKYILPGFTDMHVHFREPGFEYKETILTGSHAAQNGGYSNVCTMPNLNPVPDSLENLQPQLNAIAKDACNGVNIFPFGSITKGEKGKEVSNMEELAPYVIGFSDDGCGVENHDIMYEAMERAAKLGKPICGHCEVKSITNGGVINDGVYSHTHNLPGITNESEYAEVDRNISIAAATNCHFHVCHASTKETIDMVREAKENGIYVTCETAPQYLLLSEADLKDDGRYRFQPPLRTLRDRIALLEALRDGTIDMIATDHAPHSAAEKRKGLAGSANGIVGLECAFPILYTYLVKEKVISLPDLMRLMVENPLKHFGIGSEIKVGNIAEFCVWDLDTLTKIDSKLFCSKGKFTPFDGKEVVAQRTLTVSGNKMFR